MFTLHPHGTIHGRYCSQAFPAFAGLHVLWSMKPKIRYRVGLATSIAMNKYAFSNKHRLTFTPLSGL